MLELKQVSKTYRVGNQDFPALKNISLTIEENAFMSFVGPSGSGKTTLLNLMGGLDRPTSGQVLFDGAQLESMNRSELAQIRKQHIGFIFQSHNLLPVYSVYENVLFPLLLNHLKEQDARERVMALVEKVGLTEQANKKPAELSGGQCQRVAIARALIKRPKLVLADEPTANLDTENSFRILELMQDLNEQYGAAFVFSTHDQRVTQFINREVRLEDGAVLWDKAKNGNGELE